MLELRSEIRVAFFKLGFAPPGKGASWALLSERRLTLAETLSQFFLRWDLEGAILEPCLGV